MSQTVCVHPAVAGAQAIQVCHRLKAGTLQLPAQRQVVVVTCGEQGGYYRAADAEEVRHFAAFAVRTVDTTGCGDVFHGAYAAALARGLALTERLRFAAAAAALKATQPGAQKGIPTRGEVEAFLASRGP